MTASQRVLLTGETGMSLEQAAYLSQVIAGLAVLASLMFRWGDIARGPAVAGQAADYKAPQAVHVRPN